MAWLLSILRAADCHNDNNQFHTLSLIGRSQHCYSANSKTKEIIKNYLVSTYFWKTRVSYAILINNFYSNAILGFPLRTILESHTMLSVPTTAPDAADLSELISWCCSTLWPYADVIDSKKSTLYINVPIIFIIICFLFYSSNVSNVLAWSWITFRGKEHSSPVFG